MDGKLYYAGVGSRKTPTIVRQWMTDIAEHLRGAEYVLRSGGAQGADRSFEAGAGDRKEIFYANFAEGDDKAHELMARFHPAPHSLGAKYVRNLMARNGYQVLGRNLDDPVKFVLCWTPDGADGKNILTSRNTGGTGQAIRIAAAYGIPVINMKNDNWPVLLENLVEGEQSCQDSTVNQLRLLFDTYKGQRAAFVKRIKDKRKQS